MKKIPLQCGRMASVAEEFCALIEGERGAGWIRQLETLLPRLHVAVTALSTPANEGPTCLDHDDEKRCELYLSLSDELQGDGSLGLAYEKMAASPGQRRRLSERMADDLADMYFDIKHGLELLQEDPQKAADSWQYSFYLHWGKHLLDAECWLRAVRAGSRPVSLPEWRWPNNLASNPSANIINESALLASPA